MQLIVGLRYTNYTYRLVINILIYNKVKGVINWIDPYNHTKQ